MQTTMSKQETETAAGLRRARTIGYFAAFIVLGMATSSLGPTLTGLAENTGAQLSAVSYLFMTRSLGYMIGSQQGGRLYDRLAGHPLISGVLLVMAALLALVPVIPWLWLLIPLVTLLGIGEGTLDVGCNALILRVHREKVGPIINGLHFFFGLGAFIAPLIVAQAILLEGGIQLAYWALAVLAIPPAVWVLRLPSPNLRTREEAAADRPPFALLVALVAVFFFLYVGAEAGLAGWIFTFAVRQLGAGLTGSALTELEASAALLTSGFWGAFTVGRLLGIPVAARFRARDILRIDLLGSVTSLGVILLWSHSWLAIWAGTIGAGLFLASIFPTTLAFAERRMTITGGVMGWFLVGAGVGGMVLPWLIGQLFEAMGPQITIIAILLDVILAFMIFMLMMQVSSQRTDPDDTGL